MTTEQSHALADSAADVASAFFQAAGQLTRAGEEWVELIGAIEAGEPQRIVEAAEAVTPFDLEAHLATLSTIALASVRMLDTSADIAIDRQLEGGAY
jgi:hypothetical protein